MNQEAFEIYPAIDLRGGQVVRLVQGDPQRQTIYEPEPAAAAQRWVQSGARWLHVVNLDGAFTGSNQAGPNQAALVKILEIARAADVFVQFGGGLRTMADIDRVLGLGVSRAILGTAVVEIPGLAAQAVRQFGSNTIGAALDARAGIVHTRGWQQSGGITALELAGKLASEGVQTAIYTDISRDGLAVGANIPACLALMTGLSENTQHLQIIASGGVNALQDIRTARQAGLAGVIVGRALYQGDFTLEEALAC